MCLDWNIHAGRTNAQMLPRRRSDDIAGRYVNKSRAIEILTPEMVGAVLAARHMLAFSTRLMPEHVCQTLGHIHVRYDESLI